jgi:hypothetical protein
MTKQPAKDITGGDRTEQQVNVREEMHIGFKHKGVAPPTQSFAGLFFSDKVAGIHDKLVDLVEQFGGEQSDVVLQRFLVIVGLVEGAVAEHFAQGIVVIDFRLTWREKRSDTGFGGIEIPILYPSPFLLR